jgi:hypothetical protein
MIKSNLQPFIVSQFSNYIIIFIFCLLTRFFLFYCSYPLVHPTSQEISSRLRGSTQKKKKNNNNNNHQQQYLCRNDDECVDAYFKFILFYLNIYNIYKSII